MTRIKAMLIGILVGCGSGAHAHRVGYVAMFQSAATPSIHTDPLECREAEEWSEIVGASECPGVATRWNDVLDIQCVFRSEAGVVRAAHPCTGSQPDGQRRRVVSPRGATTVEITAACQPDTVIPIEAFDRRVRLSLPAPEDAYLTADTELELAEESSSSETTTLPRNSRLSVVRRLPSVAGGTCDIAAVRVLDAGGSRPTVRGRPLNLSEVLFYVPTASLSSSRMSGPSPTQAVAEQHAAEEAAHVQAQEERVARGDAEVLAGECSQQSLATWQRIASLAEDRIRLASDERFLDRRLSVTNSEVMVFEPGGTELQVRASMRGEYVVVALSNIRPQVAAFNARGQESQLEAQGVEQVVSMTFTDRVPIYARALRLGTNESGIVSITGRGCGAVLVIRTH